MENKNVKKIRVILPGGGVKGSFQLGVLHELLKWDDYIIDAVYGSSVGALLSPFVANSNMGQVIDTFNKIKSINDIMKRRTIFGIPLPNWKLILLYFTLLKLGAYDSFKIVEDVLNSLTEKQCEIAKGKCHVVAFDIINNKETWFSGDQLLDGIRCSSALWLAVPPIKYNDTYYSDGGVTEVFPIDYILEHELSSSFDGDYIFIDCSTRMMKKNTIDMDAITLMNTLHSNATLKVARDELIRLKSSLKNKLYVIKPEYDIITDPIDVNPNKMKELFNYGCKKGKEFLNNM